MSIREKLEWYDIQVTFILNPLNWTISRCSYFKGLQKVAFGPVSLMIYTGTDDDER